MNRRVAEQSCACSTAVETNKHVMVRQPIDAFIQHAASDLAAIKNNLFGRQIGPVNHVYEDIVAQDDLDLVVGLCSLHKTRDAVTMHQVVGAKNLHISRLDWRSAQRFGPILSQWKDAVV